MSAHNQIIAKPSGGRRHRAVRATLMSMLAGSSAVAGHSAALITTGPLAAGAGGPFDELPPDTLELVSMTTSYPQTLPAGSDDNDDNDDNSPWGTGEPDSSTTHPPASPSTTGGRDITANDLHQSDARQIAALAKATPSSTNRPTNRSSNLSSQSARPATTTTTNSSHAGAASTLGLFNTTGPGALSMAMTRLGDPYRWGARGPYAFDCSGLVQWAFKQMGITLPRTASDQSQVGEPVSEDELRPGDLIFFYSPVSHVGIYMGHGKIVHASEPGEPVKISRFRSFPYHNARRIT